MKKLLLIPLLLSLFSFAQAAAPLQISFTDLQGKMAPYKDPFKDLTEDQTYKLSIYARITDMIEFAPNRVTDPMKDELVATKTWLENEKVDTEYFLQQRLIIIEKRKQASVATNNFLDNKTISMSGFMLALQFDGDKVTEFLLVPTIGACSHKPVPPANQMLLVKSKQPVKAGAPYLPITITGKLSITPHTQDLYMVDGKKTVTMAYTMEDAKVEAYKAPQQ